MKTITNYELRTAQRESAGFMLLSSSCDTNWRSRRGFTLIETLIAVLIFSSATVFLITIVGRGVGALGSAQNQMTAFFLAQEGLETVRHIRDNNFLQNGGGVPWHQGLNQCFQNGCALDMRERKLYACDSDQCGELELRSTSLPTVYEFVHTPSLSARFRRVIEIIPATSNETILVTVSVFWRQGGIPRSVVLKERLFRWVRGTQ